MSFKDEDENTLKRIYSYLHDINTSTTDYDDFYENEKKMQKISLELESRKRKSKIFLNDIPNMEPELLELINLIENQLISLDELYIMDEFHKEVLLKTLLQRKDQAIMKIKALRTNNVPQKKEENSVNVEKEEQKVLQQKKEHEEQNMKVCKASKCDCNKRHLCEDKNCKDTKKKHLLIFLHVCPDGKECKDTKEEKHRELYVHPCKYGSECRVENDIHLQRFTHPCDKKGCSDSTRYHTVMFTHEKKAKLSKDVINARFTLNDKSKLIPHSKDWKKSAFFKITHEKKEWDFMGFEMKDKKNSDENKIVLIQKTGKGFAGGYIESFDLSKIPSPNPKQFGQPWDNENVLVVSHQNIAKEFREVLKTKIHGVNESFATVIKYIHSCGIPCFVVGGAIRDLILNEKNGTKNPIKDIDIGFGCSASEMEKIILNKYGSGSCNVGPNGLVTIGKKLNDLFLEGKSINGLNNDFVPIIGRTGTIPCTVGTDLFNENICRDFSCNSLWYDVINETIIDPTGKGISDTLNQLIRIPVDEEKWVWWEKGNPSKLLRYWKMICKGYKPADQKTKEFIMKRSKDYEKTGDINFKKICKIQYKYQSDRTGFENIIKKELGQGFWDKFFV